MERSSKTYSFIMLFAACMLGILCLQAEGFYIHTAEKIISSVKIVVYTHQETSEKAIADIKKKLGSYKEFVSIIFSDPEAAAEHLKNDNDMAGYIDAAGEDFRLPGNFELGLRIYDTARLKAIIREIETLENVVFVHYNEALVKDVRELLKKITLIKQAVFLIAVILALLLAYISGYIMILSWRDRYMMGYRVCADMKHIIVSSALRHASKGAVCALLASAFFFILSRFPGHRIYINLIYGLIFILSAAVMSGLLYLLVYRIERKRIIE